MTVVNQKQQPRVRQRVAYRYIERRSCRTRTFRMSTNSNEHDPIRDWILTGIDRSERGKWTIKLRTLVQGFGYTAQQRMRQSSLLVVETTLTDWGIVFSYPGGYTPDDRITLSRR